MTTKAGENTVFAKREIVSSSGTTPFIPRILDTAIINAFNRYFVVKKSILLTITALEASSSRKHIQRVRN
jgi:hypothetical protein